MTQEDYYQYRELIRASYMNYTVDLHKKCKVSTVDLQEEFDTKLWLLSKAISIIFSFNLDGYNNFTTEEMLQWQNIMNDIMKTRLYINFIID